MKPVTCIQFLSSASPGQPRIFVPDGSRSNMATLERGADACIKWARTHLKPLRPLEWRVHLGTFSSSQDSTGVQITLTCSKAFRTRGEGSIDRPGRRKFVGTFDECMAWLEPYVRML